MKTNFSKILLKILEDNNLKQEELAERVGLTQSAISKYINSQSPSFDIAVKILETFNYNISDFDQYKIREASDDYDAEKEIVLKKYNYYKKIIEDRFGSEYL